MFFWIMKLHGVAGGKGQIIEYVLAKVSVLEQQEHTLF